jgi:hypothetical protein
MLVRIPALCVLIVSSALLVAGASAAAPIQVEYLVDQKAFKKGTTALTELEFQLHSDGACTVPLGGR